MDPLRGNDGLAAQPEEPEPLGVRALDFAGCGLQNGSVRKLAHILKVNTTVTRLVCVCQCARVYTAPCVVQQLFIPTE